MPTKLSQSVVIGAVFAFSLAALSAGAIAQQATPRPAAPKAGPAPAPAAAPKAAVPKAKAAPPPAPFVQAAVVQPAGAPCDGCRHTLRKRVAVVGALWQPPPPPRLQDIIAEGVPAAAAQGQLKEDLAAHAERVAMKGAAHSNAPATVVAGEGERLVAAQAAALAASLRTGAGIEIVSGPGVTAQVARVRAGRAFYSAAPQTPEADILIIVRPDQRNAYTFNTNTVAGTPQTAAKRTRLDQLNTNANAARQRAANYQQAAQRDFADVQAADRRGRDCELQQQRNVQAAGANTAALAMAATLAVTACNGHYNAAQNARNAQANNNARATSENQAAQNLATQIAALQAEINRETGEGRTATHRLSAGGVAEIFIETTESLRSIMPLSVPWSASGQQLERVAASGGHDYALAARGAADAAITQISAAPAGYRTAAAGERLTPADTTHNRIWDLVFAARKASFAIASSPSGVTLDVGQREGVQVGDVYSRTERVEVTPARLLPDGTRVEATVERRRVRLHVTQVNAQTSIAQPFVREFDVARDQEFTWEMRYEIPPAPAPTPAPAAEPASAPPAAPATPN